MSKKLSVAERDALRTECIDELMALVGSGDPEGAHGSAEDVLLDYLRAIGEGAVADTYEHVSEEFWYA